MRMALDTATVEALAIAAMLAGVVLCVLWAFVAGRGEWPGDLDREGDGL